MKESQTLFILIDIFFFPGTKSLQAGRFESDEWCSRRINQGLFTVVGKLVNFLFHSDLKILVEGGLKKKNLKDGEIFLTVSI